MTMISDHSWRAEFARSAAFREQQVRFQRDLSRKSKAERESQRVDDDIMDMASTAVTVMATEVQLAKLEADLDDYRTATVESLMEDEERLVELRDRLDSMLAEAHVLPDGTRVFKTVDGTRVFDENGNELSPEIIEPDLIEDWRPKAERYMPVLREEQEVLAAQKQKLDLLDRIDEAEQRIDGGDLSADDVDRIQAELEEFAPIDVKRRVAGLDSETQEPTLSQDFGSAARDLTMPSLPGLKPETLGL